ncbi:hypothetical protein CKO27_23825 [Thiocystis violacea]|nr:hypothetical protein [Thiocystis violacea]
MNSGIAICQEDVAASFRSRIQVKVTMNNKVYISAIISITIIVICIIAYLFLGANPREDLLEKQIIEYKIEIEQMRASNAKYINEIKDLNVEVSRINASQPGGAAVEEIRKALSEKETRLQNTEDHLVKNEKALQIRQENLDKLHLEFFEKTGLKMEDIGAAKEIKSNFAEMKEKLNDAQEMANYWLIPGSVN